MTLLPVRPIFKGVAHSQENCDCARLFTRAPSVGEWKSADALVFDWMYANQVLLPDDQVSDLVSRVAHLLWMESEDGGIAR